MAETWSETDDYGLERMAAQAGTRRRYSYDQGLTWRSTPAKARDAAGILGSYEIGGICVLMTSSQASRWNCGDVSSRDLNTVKVVIAKDDGAERMMTLRRATCPRLEPQIAKYMEDCEAVFVRY